MAPRSIATGTISFGLVSIPVKLFSTGESEVGVHFNMLHGKCGTRLKQQYVCPTDDNEVVPRSDIVKGYEFSKGQYVTFTKEELKTLEEEATKSIEIAEFVPAEKVDPVYFEKPYYVAPDKGGDKAYRLLGEAMRTTGRAALARYAARGKQYLVMIRPFAGGLVMQQLRYADEVKSFAEVEIGAGEVKKAELDLAVQLIEQIATDVFAPEKYRDDVRDRTLEKIQGKIDGQEITATPVETPKAQIIDLMDALKQSLGEPVAERKGHKGAGRPASKEAEPRTSEA